MDDITADRISKLAKSMKDLHLSATIEEAYKRAEEIILGSLHLEKSAREVENNSEISEEIVELEIKEIH